MFKNMYKFPGMAEQQQKQMDERKAAKARQVARDTVQAKLAFQEFILNCSSGEGGSTTAYVMGFKVPRTLLAVRPDIANKAFTILNTESRYVTEAQVEALKALLAEF